MHVASVHDLRGRAARLRRVRGVHRGPAAPRPALPPEARVRAARPGPARLGRRPALQPRYHVRHTRAARARAATSSSQRSPGALFAPAAGPPQAAVGDPPRRGPRPGGDALRADLPRRTTRSSTASRGVDITSVLFDARPTRCPPRRERRAWSPRPEPLRGRSCSRDALLERATMPGEGARGVRALARAAAPGARRMPASAWSAPARWPGRASSPAPATPLNVPIGPHRRYGWVDGAARPLQGDQERARRHAERRRPGRGLARARALPAPPRRRRPTASCSR